MSPYTRSSAPTNQKAPITSSVGRTSILQKCIDFLFDSVSHLAKTAAVVLTTKLDFQPGGELGSPDVSRTRTSEAIIVSVACYLARKGRQLRKERKKEPTEN